MNMDVYGFWNLQDMRDLGEDKGINDDEKNFILKKFTGHFHFVDLQHCY
jgi:hypothetical protein